MPGPRADGAHPGAIEGASGTPVELRPIIFVTLGPGRGQSRAGARFRPPRSSAHRRCHRCSGRRLVGVGSRARLRRPVAGVVRRPRNGALAGRVTSRDHAGAWHLTSARPGRQIGRSGALRAMPLLFMTGDGHPALVETYPGATRRCAQTQVSAGSTPAHSHRRAREGPPAPGFRGDPPRRTRRHEAVLASPTRNGRLQRGAPS
jgi:hypothetical protein